MYEVCLDGCLGPVDLDPPLLSVSDALLSNFSDWALVSWLDGVTFGCENILVRRRVKLGFLEVGASPFGGGACFVSGAEIGRYDDFASCDCRDDEESEGERVEDVG